MANLTLLEEILGVTFKDKTGLVAALVHSSFVNENPGYESNERLEFLGDAVLGLVIGERLYEGLSRADEGELTRKRASIVSRESLGRIAKNIGLGDYLLLGKGEEASGGANKTANLAGVMEAVIAAIYLDGGIEAARSAIVRLFDKELLKSTCDQSEVDYKSRLQEYTQSEGKGIPVYRVAGASGPDHARVFTVEVLVDGEVRGTGSGQSKKAAESEAARRAMGGEQY